MIQREVAKRICAAPGTADYGAFSVYCQYYTDPEILFEVPPDWADRLLSRVLRRRAKAARTTRKKWSGSST